MTHCASCGQENEVEDGVCRHCGADLIAAPRGVLYQPQFHATSAIVLANSLIFLAMLVQGSLLVRSLGGISLPQFVPGQLVAWGANWGPLTLSVQPWRLLTSNYVHGGLGHIVTNMFCLWGLGRLAEHFYPKIDFVLAYTLTGVAGSLLSVFIRPLGAPSVGASGAVFGIAGLMLATLKWGHVPIDGATRAVMYRDIMRFAALNLVIGFFVPHIDNMGHLGGLLAGVLVGMVMGRNLDDSERARGYRRLAWGALTVGLLLATWGVTRFHHRLIWEVLQQQR